MSTVRRFWIEFDVRDRPAPWPGRAIGVTGFDVRDCLAMAADLVTGGRLPPVRRITADISLAAPLPLNPRHLGVPVWRGVWYPPVNLGTGPVRAIDSRGISGDHPIPTPPSLHRTRIEGPLRSTWWDEIPYFSALRWPLMDIHRDGRMRYHAPEVRDMCVTDSTYGMLVREALDYMIVRRPTPREWFDPTGVAFADERELSDYLRAFRDYLAGIRPEPICSPAGEQLSRDARPRPHDDT